MPRDSINRRRVLKTIGGTSVGVSLAGCTGGNSTPTSGSGNSDGITPSEGEWPDLSGQEVHVLFDESSDYYVNYVKEVSRQFEEATGATVKNEFIGVGVGPERITQLLQAGDPPEVHKATPLEMMKFANSGASGSVQSAMEAITEIYGGTYDATDIRHDGEYHFAPMYLQTGGTLYRGDRMELPENPTWEEELEAVKNADGEIPGTSVYAGQSICTDLEVLGFGYSAGARMLAREKGKVTCVLNDGENRQKWINALNHMKDLHQYSAENSDAGCLELINAIPDEHSNHQWNIGYRGKELAIKQDKPFASDVRTSVIPVPESGMDPVNVATYEGLMTFEQANTEAGNVFIEFFFQPDRFIDFTWVIPFGTLPAYPAALEMEKLQSLIDDLDDELWTEADVEAALTSAQHTMHPAVETEPPNVVSGAIYDSRLLSDLTFDVLISDRPVGEAVDHYATEIQKVIDEEQE